MTNITQLPEWQALIEHQQELAQTSICDLFTADPKRFAALSLQAADLFLDYSKHRIAAKTVKLLAKLAQAADLVKHRDQLFTGQAINNTEDRPALHTALRNSSDKAVYTNGKDIMPEIHHTLKVMAKLVNALTKEQWLGYTGKPIKDIVNIGIGGSDLGPKMATMALADFAKGSLRCHFVSNIDSTQIIATLRTLNPGTTLFIISSKSFCTQETLCNAATAKAWLQKAGFSAAALDKHFLAVTSNKQKAQAFGIGADNILPIWPWVGGRFSLWSAVGLPIALTVGMKNFNQLLAGAYAMDRHFLTAPLQSNMPVILALLSIWYINFWGAKSHAVLPYCEALALLPSYLQQAEMESNGKRVMRDGTTVTYATTPVIWGTTGTNGQHSFHQFFYQGTQLVPMDFILPVQNQNPLPQHQEMLIADCFAQSRALMQGKTATQAYAELIQQGYSETNALKLAAHKEIPGNCPSSTLLMPKLTPFTLGALIALYEHKIFTQGVIWNINSFDQWGVELGKQKAHEIIECLHNHSGGKQLDASTAGLINYSKNLKPFSKT